MQALSPAVDDIGTGRFQVRDYQSEYCSMEQQTTRKSYKYKLKPTPEQERQLERTLMLCRHV